MNKFSTALVLVALTVFAGHAHSKRPALSASEKLDSAAFYALAQRDEVRLKAAREKGGDPERFARENPQAIHYAAGTEGDLDTLAFVLKTGANPNAPSHPGSKGGPILSAGLDPEKITLLLKAGADINGVDHNYYTVLSYALFDSKREFQFPAASSVRKPEQKQRVYSKLDIVRVLVEAGAALNDGPGAATHGGMLALTRPEDEDVIDYLVARGASLKWVPLFPVDSEKDAVTRGPLVSALMREREDLALRLLKGNKEVAADDRLALLHAARRGFGDLSIALLAAGSDPKATDQDGSTPLMWARKARDQRLIAALLKAGAPDSPALPKVSFEREGLNDFDKKSGLIIDDVAFMDSPRFALDVYLPKRGEPSFALYGAEANKFEQLSCDRASAFTIIALMGATNSIQVGICKTQMKRVLAGIEQSRKSLRDAVTTLGGGATADPAMLEKLGWTFKETQLPRGARSYEFPLLLIGHGIIGIRTYVLIDKSASRAVIIQASVDGLCERSVIRTPLCRDPSRAFAEIAERVSRLAD